MKNYKEDNILIDIGDKITHMPLVLEGTIKIMTEDEEENELLLYYLEFGDTCAITISCCTKKTKSTIRAITESPTEILLVPVDKMEEWMIKYKSWRTYILDSYNSRLNEMLSAIDNIVFNSMEDRLKKYLRDKAWMAKSDKIYISHADIANDMHSSRVVISRLMKKIETQGIIKQHRNMVEYLEFQTPNI
ncbi:MAG: Crp/Fnr family transcriptional regulator [Saprospiraceae bacterium]